MDWDLLDKNFLKILKKKNTEMDNLKGIQFNMMWTRARTLNGHIPGSMQILLY